MKIYTSESSTTTHYYAISEGKSLWFLDKATGKNSYLYNFIGWNSKTDWYDSASGGYIPATHKFLSGNSYPYMGGVFIYVYDDMQEAEQALQQMQAEFYSKLDLIPLELDTVARRLYPIN